MSISKEECQVEALKYIKRSDFKKNSNGIYRQASYRGWLEEITSHMPIPHRWTEEEIRKEALKYQSRGEFQDKNQVAYNAAKRLNIKDEVCLHMKRLKNIFDIDSLKKEAQKYNSKKEFSTQNQQAYSFAVKNGILQEVCSHMKGGSKRWEDFGDGELLEKANSFCSISILVKENIRLYQCLSGRGLLSDKRLLLLRERNYYSEDQIRDKALEYESRSEFKKNNPSMYRSARTGGFLDKICRHMGRLGNNYLRCVYSFEWGNKYVYVGLTGNFNRRLSSHKESERYLYFTNQYGEPKITKTEYVYTKDTCGQKEEEILQEYVSKGWISLNKAKTGGLGGNNIKNTKEKCLEVASRYTLLSKFSNENRSMYSSIIKNKWYDTISHLKRRIRIDEEEVKKEARSYCTKARLLKENRRVYHYVYMKGWLEELFP